MLENGKSWAWMYITSCIFLSIFLLCFQFQFCDVGVQNGIQKNITTQWECLLNPFHHMLYEIGKTTLQNSDFIKIWNVIQIWISFQNESVRLESDLKNSIMALPYLAIPSSICVQMQFGTFCHFLTSWVLREILHSAPKPLSFSGLLRDTNLSGALWAFWKWQNVPNLSISTHIEEGIER